MYHALIFTAATSPWTHLPLQTSAIITLSHWDFFQVIQISDESCVASYWDWNTAWLHSKHGLNTFWLTAEQWISLHWIYFICRQWGRAAVVFYCNCSTMCFIVHIRDRNKKSESWYVMARDISASACLNYIHEVRGKGDQCACGTLYVWPLRKQPPSNSIKSWLQMRHAGSVLALCHSAPDPNNLSGAMWTHSPVEKSYTNTWAIWMFAGYRNSSSLFTPVNSQHFYGVSKEISLSHRPKPELLNTGLV